MARIYPQFLPGDLRSEPGRAAEVKVYDALKSLPDDYIVFYSVNWLWRKRDMASHKKELHKKYPPELGGLSKGTPYPIGETDFIMIAPDFGLIVIEVKGGSINIVNGTWYSIDRKGTPHSIQPPLEQAKKNMYALIAKLQEIPRFRNHQFTLGYAVILPDVQHHTGTLALTLLYNCLLLLRK